MSLLISAALAADTAGAAVPPSPPLLMNLLPFLLIFIVFYFLLIRPQMKKQKEQQEMINSIQRGEKIVTSGGIVGTVVKVEEDDSELLQVEIAQGVKVKLLKSSVTAVISRAPQGETKTEEKTK